MLDISLIKSWGECKPHGAPTVRTVTPQGLAPFAMVTATLRLEVGSASQCVGWESVFPGLRLAHQAFVDDHEDPTGKYHAVWVPPAGWDAEVLLGSALERVGGGLAKIERISFYAERNRAHIDIKLMWREVQLGASLENLLLLLSQPRVPAEIFDRQLDLPFERDTPQSQQETDDVLRF